MTPIAPALSGQPPTTAARWTPPAGRPRVSPARGLPPETLAQVVLWPGVGPRLWTQLRDGVACGRGVDSRAEATRAIVHLAGKVADGVATDAEGPVAGSCRAALEVLAPQAMLGLGRLSDAALGWRRSALPAPDAAQLAADAALVAALPQAAAIASLAREAAPGWDLAMCQLATLAAFEVPAAPQWTPSNRLFAGLNRSQGVACTHLAELNLAIPAARELEQLLLSNLPFAPALAGHSDALKLRSLAMSEQRAELEAGLAELTLFAYSQEQRFQGWRARMCVRRSLAAHPALWDSLPNR